MDFAHVDFCDSSGLRALDQAYATATTTGVTFRLVNPKPTIQLILKLTGMLDTLTGA